MKLRGMRVLVVEDDPSARELLTKPIEPQQLCDTVAAVAGAGS